jgi:hypothetical protein
MVGRVLFFAALALVPSVAVSADTKRLAFSERLGVEVFALPDSAGNWCGARLRLRMEVAPGSPLNDPEELRRFVPRLAPVFSQECPAAADATVEGLAKKDGKPIGQTFRAARASSWNAVADEPAPARAQAPATSGSPPSQPPALPQAGSAAPSGSSTAAAQPPAPASASAAATASPPADTAKGADEWRWPEINGGMAALLRYLRDNPAVAKSPAVADAWLRTRFADQYRQAYGNEFRMERARLMAIDDIAATAARAGDTIFLSLGAQLGAYDQSRRAFPLEGLSEQISTSNPLGYVAPAPAAFDLRIEGLAAISELQMGPDDAQRLLESRRSSYGSYDRLVVVALQIRLRDPGFTPAQYGRVGARAEIVAVRVFADREGKRTLLALSGADVARLAGEARERERQKRLAEVRNRFETERDAMLRALEQMPPDRRMANFLGEERPAYQARLDSIRTARASALLDGGLDVKLLVQADGDGREKVPTRWPGRLLVDLAEGMPALAGGRWYLVTGRVRLDDVGGDARLAAGSIHACDKPQCADAADPAEILRKMAETALAKVR